MSYPDYPSNRLIVNGVDLTEKFKMVLADGYTLSPPEPKTYTVDIPGGHGKLDLTESLFGDTAYDNRKQEFTFYVINTPNFEKVKTSVSNFLHGRSYDYQITMDPEYIYNGRFKVTGYEHSAYSSGIVGCIKIEIDAKPFKYKNTQVFKVDGIGGNTYYFESGRKQVCPIIESDGYLKVIHNGTLYTLTQGTWMINDLYFESGINELYFNSFDIHSITWGYLLDNEITWGMLGKKPLYEWYKTDENGQVVNTRWSDVSDKTWSDMADKTWLDNFYRYETTKVIKNTYIKYEWSDL